MQSFVALDGTRLCYHVTGKGDPVICLPGGPMQDSAYLDDLGGLTGRLRLFLLDNRGTGESETPADARSYRCDHLVDDVEALREHLGLDQMNLLAHSGGANLAVLYAVRHPDRVSRLALITPSTFSVGILASSQVRREVIRLREGEPWFAPAVAAFEAIAAGHATDAEWETITPFTYGRWDAAAQAHHASEDGHKNERAAAVFGSEGAFHPEATRAKLADFAAPTLILAGERDVAGPPPAITEFAGLFSNSTFVVQPGAGHFPWLDDASEFARTVGDFLGR